MYRIVTVSNVNILQDILSILCGYFESIYFENLTLTISRCLFVRKYYNFFIINLI